MQEISRGVIPAARSPGLLSRRVSKPPQSDLDCLSRTEHLTGQAGTLDAHFKTEAAKAVPDERGVSVVIDLRRIARQDAPRPTDPRAAETPWRAVRAPRWIK